MNRLNLTTVSLITVLALVGCGGGSDSSSDSSNVGTGYYVDSPVTGVDFKCGTQKGKTGEQGKFTFDKGSNCTFSLAGITLRETQADELIDGKEILENNLKVAQFLQSIDSNGKLSDGIQIDDKVLEALTKALEETQSVGKLPEGTKLVEVVAAVGHDVQEVSGDVVSEDAAREHLIGTETTITKKLLSGKTFYSVYKEGEKSYIESLTFNKEVSKLTFSEEGKSSSTIDIKILGNAILEEYGKHIITNVTEKYIVVNDSRGEWKAYYDKSDAKAQLGGSGASSTNTLSDLIIGKTVYQHVKNEDGTEDWIEVMTVNSNGTLTFEDSSDILYYRIVGNTIYTRDTATETEEEPHTLLKYTDEYIKFREKEGDTSIFYFTRALAQAAPADYDGAGSSSATLLTITPNMLKGKVFYLDHNENHETEISYNKATVIDATHISIHEIRVNKSTKSETMNETQTISYSLINGNIILHLGKEEGGDIFFSLISQNKTQWNLLITESDGTSFTDSWYLNKPSTYPSSL